MDRYSQKKTLSYTTQQLFDIVIDVESYPKFLPWCKASRIINQTDAFNFDAVLTVGYKSINESYTSKVESIYLKKIKSTATEGPFRMLESFWLFNDKKDCCEVEFNIQYEFKSFFLGKVMGGMFKKASEKMFSAFENRAQSLYR